jgi:XTP/dITP diphosphohydrolase
MKVILATSNKGKVKELKEILPEFDLIAYRDILGDFEIEENGKTFAQNALIKARAIFEKLKDEKNFIVLSDDSGISLPILDHKPGIFSARYAGENASDKDNLEKLIQEIKNLNLDSALAYYTAAVAVVGNLGEWVSHGWMYGKVITTPRGDKGFGYDPIFIPNGYTKTLGELESKIKQKLSHRSKAVENIKPLLEMLKRKLN